MIDNHPFYCHCDSAAYLQTNLRGETKLLIWVASGLDISANMYTLINPFEHINIIQSWANTKKDDLLSYMVGKPGILELKERRFLTREEFDPWRHLPWT